MQNESDPDQVESRAAPRLPASLAVTYRTAKRIFILVVGGTLAVIGALFLFSPMPGAAAVLVVGLGILGLEFEFARRWLVAFKEKSAAAAERWRKRRQPGTRGRRSVHTESPGGEDARGREVQEESSGRSRK